MPMVFAQKFETQREEAWTVVIADDRAGSRTGPVTVLRKRADMGAKGRFDQRNYNGLRKARNLRERTARDRQLKHDFTEVARSDGWVSVTSIGEIKDVMVDRRIPLDLINRASDLDRIFGSEPVNEAESESAKAEPQPEPTEEKPALWGTW